MCTTCRYSSSVSNMIQIRSVPDVVHATLKSPAALVGPPLTDYLLAKIQRVAKRPTSQELAERLLYRPRVSLKTSPSKAVRAEWD